MRCFQKRWLCLGLIRAMTLLACSDNDTGDIGNASKLSRKFDSVIIIGVTTTLEDAGLLSELVNAFQHEHKITVKAIVAGSGQIHQLLERGDLDLAITHDPIGEKALVIKGIIKQRLPFMQNDFIFVGPASDPASISLSPTPLEVLQEIIKVNALFVSRGDNSGTHQMEQYWWKKINRHPADQYYLKTGTGMGATLNIVAERNAYSLVDRATWTKFTNKQKLVVLFENPELLPNIYSLLIKDKAPQQEEVILWQEWISEGQGLQIILDYRVNGQPLFFKASKKS